MNWVMVLVVGALILVGLVGASNEFYQWWRSQRITQSRRGRIHLAFELKPPGESDPDYRAAARLAAGPPVPPIKWPLEGLPAPDLGASPVPLPVISDAPTPSVKMPRRSGYTVTPPLKPQLRPGKSESAATSGTQPSACGKPTVAACASTTNHGSRSEFCATAGAASDSSSASAPRNPRHSGTLIPGCLCGDGCFAPRLLDDAHAGTGANPRRARRHHCLHLFEIANPA